MPKTPSALPFEADFKDIQANPDAYVDAIFANLGSGFLVLPRGPGFIDYPMFERGYEALKLATEGFVHIESDRVLSVALATPMAIIVLRSILGFTPPEERSLPYERWTVWWPAPASRSLPPPGQTGFQGHEKGNPNDF